MKIVVTGYLWYIGSVVYADLTHSDIQLTGLDIKSGQSIVDSRGLSGDILIH